MPIVKYPKIVHFDDEITERVKQGKLSIEEKIDGSQFRIFIDNGVIQCGSKSIDYNEERLPDNMFNLGIIEANDVFKGSKLKDTMIFAEYIRKPKHNTMTYARTPKHLFIVFDVSDGGKLLPYKDKLKFCKKHGLEVVPELWVGKGQELNMELITELLKNESVLGREQIEGLVFKNHDNIWDYGYQAGKPIILKHVREEFKERNKAGWKISHKKGFIEDLIEQLSTEARWNKSIQHLRDEGKLENSPKDLAILLPEIIKDLEQEEGERLKEEVWKFFRKEIRRGVIKGFPQYYKDMLLKEAIK